MAFSPGFSNVRRQLLPLSHAQSPCDVSIGQRLVPNILLQHGSAALTGAPPQFPSSLSHLVMLMLLRDKVPLATALRLCATAVAEGWGKGELRFEVGSKLHCGLFLPRQHPPIKASLRSGCFCFLASPCRLLSQLLLARAVVTTPAR